MIGTILLIFIAVFIFIKLFNSFGNSNYDTDNDKESASKIKTALNLKSHDDNKVNGTIQAIDDNLADDIMQIKSTFDNFGLEDIRLVNKEQE